MKKSTLTLILLLLTPIFLIAQQNLSKELADKYIATKGELTFTFKIKDHTEIEQFGKNLSIVYYDKKTNIVTAWANEEQFSAFLQKNIDFEVPKEENEVDPKLIYDGKKQNLSASTSRRANTLTFPVANYPTYAQYAQQMQDFEDNYPTLVEKISLGATTQNDGKELLFVKISDNVATDEQEPKLLFTSSMHGDEIAGYPMMLSLIDYILTVYADTGHADHARVKNLVENSEIWINPLANPDGTYHNSATNTSVAQARRGNYNNIDLNRNYPDNVAGPHYDGYAYQVETLAFMNLADNNHFVIAANFHGGTELVNYPFDNAYAATYTHPDGGWFEDISVEYATHCQNDSDTLGDFTYMTVDEDNHIYPSQGVTHGAEWYRVFGGRQDYMNFYQQCREVTVELSDVKILQESNLVNYWLYNRDALLDYLTQGTYGFRGVVKDINTDDPLNAKVTIVGHDNYGSHTFSDISHGDYYRPISSGTYDILFEVDCYEPVTLSSQTISNYKTTVMLSDVLMTPVANSAPTNLTSSNVGGSSATVAWDAITGASYDYRYRAVGTPSWTTTNTSNNSEVLSSLTMNTQYEVQVRSTCDANTSSYSSSMLFTTLNSTTLHQGYFESNTDNWIVGGGDSFHYTGGVFAYENNGALRIRDNSGANSTVTSPTFNLSSYDSVEISFYFYPLGMETNEYFVLEFYNGSSWQNVGTYISGTDFSNGSFHNVTHNLDGGTFNLNNSARFRFRCEASNNSDDIYIDQVIIKGNDTPPLSNTDIDFENNLRISPNPFTNDLLISVPQNINYDKLEITVLDIRGRQLINKEYANNFSKMKLSNLNSLASGTYFIKIIDKSNQISTIRKLIKR
jgi:hypothetical protein